MKKEKDPQCYECGKGKYLKHKSELTISHTYIGNITVPNVEFRKCESCGELLLPCDTCGILDKEYERVKQEWILSQPLKEFMISQEVSKYLGISPMLLSRHHRIRRGFIFRVRIGKQTLYLRKSVEQYKKTGDGRFVTNPIIFEENKNVHLLKGRPLGRVLLKMGKITREQIDIALDEQRNIFISQSRGVNPPIMGEVLVSLGFVTREDVKEALAEQLGMTLEVYDDFQRKLRNEAL